MSPVLPDVERRRAGWWLIAAGLFAAVGYFVYSFIGTFVLGLFVYYGARPVNRRLRHRLDDRSAAAALTLLCIVVPVLALLSYTAIVAIREFGAAAGSDAVKDLLVRLLGDGSSLTSVLQNPQQAFGRLADLPQFRQGVDVAVGTLGAVSNVLLHLTLALAFAFFLYRDGDRLAAWFRAEVGGRDTAANAWLAGADADLEVVYFGNVLTVLGVTVAAVVAYNGYNLLAPAAVAMPFPTLLAVLTGLATFVPLVVGKLVYVPVAAILAYRATQADASLLVYPVGFLVVAFLFLDLLPQSVLRPYISGQTLHEGAVLFAYVLGAVLFGWYGLFLGPLLLVLVVQFVNVVLGNLLYGEPFTAETTGTTTLGTDPTDAHASVSGED
ncbi:AI-2E family transporter [Halorarius halobius]|uniref:AI-2E family transporter n=1 Tax=Halorarius halobius TaxID=2962671 RepID=UPI0020CF195C|nr:AI-2E family transporter [Halorarius halobius]